ncbi:MAG: tRNA lysidine(34) synthetase TilS, partial [Bacteroidales bacterium]|nr:tRNA lysidine(34) synthetase TilS [Bacteroidales bacterium]
LFEQKKSDFIRSEDGVMQVDIPALLSEAHREYWLFCIFDGYGFNDTQIKQISESLESQSGKVFISQTHKVIRDRKTLKIYPLDEPSARRRISITVVPRPTDFLVKKRDESVQYLDADKVKMPLHCRKWQPADKFKPLGMKGFKKLSDFFTDLKLDLEQKKRQVVVTTVDKKGNEQIVCILGTRIDDRYKVTAKTKNLVRIAVKSKATS